MVQGLLEGLVGGGCEGVLATTRFVVVPMVNPDGVVAGNHRCSVAGYDLNRQFLEENPGLFPEVTGIKALIRKSIERGEQV